MGGEFVKQKKGSCNITHRAGAILTTLQICLLQKLQILYSDLNWNETMQTLWCLCFFMTLSSISAYLEQALIRIRRGVFHSHSHYAIFCHTFGNRQLFDETKQSGDLKTKLTILKEYKDDEGFECLQNEWMNEHWVPVSKLKKLLLETSCYLALKQNKLAGTLYFPKFPYFHWSSSACYLEHERKFSSATKYGLIWEVRQ